MTYQQHGVNQKDIMGTYIKIRHRSTIVHSYNETKVLPTKEELKSYILEMMRGERLIESFYKHEIDGANILLTLHEANN